MGEIGKRINFASYQGVLFLLQDFNENRNDVPFCLDVCCKVDTASRYHRLGFASLDKLSYRFKQFVGDGFGVYLEAAFANRLFDFGYARSINDTDVSKIFLDRL